MSETRATIRHMPVYLAASLLNRGTAFLQLLILTHFLSSGEYGVLGVIIPAGEMIGELISVQLPTAVARFYFDHKEERERDRVVATAVLGILGMAVLAAPLIYIFNAVLSSWIFSGEASSELASLTPEQAGHIRKMLGLCVGCVVCNSLFELSLNYLRAQQRSGAVLFASSARSALYLLLTALFVIVFRNGAPGALWAQFIAFSLASAVMLVPVFRRTGLAFSISQLRAMMTFSVPFVPALLAELARRFVERKRVINVCSLADADRYTLGSRFSELLAQLLLTPFAHVYAVHRLEAHRDGRPDPDGPRLFTYFFLLMSTACLGLSLLAREALMIVAPHRFYDAAIVMPLMLLGIAIFSITLIAELGIYYTKTGYRITIAAVITLLFHVPMTYALVDRYGALGGAIASCTAVAIRVALTVWLSRGLGGPKPEWLRLGVILSAAVAAYLLGANMNAANEWVGLVGRFLIACLFPLLIVMSPLFRGNERERLAQMIGEGVRKVRLRVAMGAPAKP